MKNRVLCGVMLALLTLGSAFAEDVGLRKGHPDHYVVKEGDTLWGIAARFLAEPWRWPEVWHVNPEIRDPHLIFPGDVISLSLLGGKPSLYVSRGRPTIKLSPRTRATPLQLAIPTIPINAIRQFLTQPRVLEDDALVHAPYVVDIAGESVVGGAGNQVYVRAIFEANGRNYTVLRPGNIYTDPDTGENLGFAALYLGDAKLSRTGDPATLTLMSSVQEITIGDRVLPANEHEYQEAFLPRAPEFPVEGKIIEVLNGVTQIGQFNVVTINRGEREGLQKGHVLAVYQAGEVIPDVVSPNPRETVRLPNERAGYLMVFRTFNKVSYGLIMSATRSMHMLDIVTNP